MLYLIVLTSLFCLFKIRSLLCQVLINHINVIILLEYPFINRLLDLQKLNGPSKCDTVVLSNNKINI